MVKIHFKKVSTLSEQFHQVFKTYFQNLANKNTLPKEQYKAPPQENSYSLMIGSFYSFKEWLITICLKKSICV